MTAEEWSWKWLKARSRRWCSLCGQIIVTGDGFWLGSHRRNDSRASRHRFVCRDCQPRRHLAEGLA